MNMPSKEEWENMSDDEKIKEINKIQEIFNKLDPTFGSKNIIPVKTPTFVVKKLDPKEE